jgi:PadR family transcriptional regulator PadR
LHFYKRSDTVVPVEAGVEVVLPACPSARLPVCPPMPPIDLPQGTLDLLILKALSLQPMHGWAISERLHQVSRTTLQVPQGSLYPALHRLERRGLIKAEWGASDNNRKAKYYELTRAGRKQLAAETAAWEQLTTAVALVLDQA